jgi:hypothetical protein
VLNATIIELVSDVDEELELEELELLEELWVRNVCDGGPSGLSSSCENEVTVVISGMSLMR